MAEPEVTPKLLASTTGNAEGYAPISWTAIASLAVAVAFLALTAWRAAVAIGDRQSLIEPRLLVFPFAAVLLAFVARRQILGSEGTRTGLRYANAAWYIAAVGGLTYATYLFAIEYTISRDAKREFLAFANRLVDLKPANPVDPGLYAAVYALIPPGARGSVGGDGDAAGMDAGFKDVVLGFRSTDLVRVCSRNTGRVTFATTGLVDWEQKPRLITCTIKARMTCPEGDFDLVVPMRAEVEDNRQRRWMVVAGKEGFVRGRRLTPYGWLVEGVEQAGRQVVSDLMYALSRPNTSNLALMGFVLPDSDLARASKLTDAMNASVVGRSAVAGPLGIVPALPPNAEPTLAGLFARPDGKPLTENERRMFREAWANPQRITAPGVSLKTNADAATQLLLGDGTVTLSQSAEVVLSQEGQAPPTARAKVLLSLPAAAEAELAAELNRLRDASATAVKLDEVPPDLVAKCRALPWRVSRIVSDLKAVPVARDGPGGPPGGDGGMMGSH